MVEHSAVNRVVVGSSPTRGANFKALISADIKAFSFLFNSYFPILYYFLQLNLHHISYINFFTLQ